MKCKNWVYHIQILMILFIAVLPYSCINSDSETNNNSFDNQTIKRSETNQKKTNYGLENRDKRDSVKIPASEYQNDEDFFYESTTFNFSVDDESRFLDADFYEININPNGDYEKLKIKIARDRDNFKIKYQQADNGEKSKIIKEASEYITETLVNRIFPFWYGMPWNLAGYSDIPNDGEVGCSYFVSNTMKHAGFKLNRYTLAQQNTRNIALSIQLNDSILILSGKNDISTVKNYFVKNKKEGLYYVGLDCHVGFLLYRKKELFFIQSNYASPMVVLTEFSEKSDVFMSNKYYIADISRNQALIKKWIWGEELSVRRD